jgi:hypothetical protein
MIYRFNTFSTFFDLTLQASSLTLLRRHDLPVACSLKREAI